MATLTLIAVGIISLVLVVVLRAQLEMFRDVRQLRHAAGIMDRPLDVGIEAIAGTAPSEYGLPEALDSAPNALLLFFSDKCLTCRVIASSLNQSLPLGIWVLAQARDAAAAENFIDITGMVPHERVIQDLGGEIANRLGIDVSPVGFRIENGRFASATTVPSIRYLESIAPKPIKLKTATPLETNT